MGDVVHVSRQSIASVQGAARRLRRQATAAEETLWSHLRGGRLRGLRFRRQHPIRAFILDFYCPSARLAIEIDGSMHDDPSIQTHDRQRTLALEAVGITVLRFSNEQVLRSPQTVLSAIARATTNT